MNLSTWKDLKMHFGFYIEARDYEQDEDVNTFGGKSKSQVYSIRSEKSPSTPLLVLYIAIT